MTIYIGIGVLGSNSSYRVNNIMLGSNDVAGLIIIVYIYVTKLSSCILY